MKIKNALNLPEPFVAACRSDIRELSDVRRISVTRLVDSPYLAALLREKWDEIEVDASEMVWSILGKAIHGVFQYSSDEGAELKIEVEYDHDTVIVGVIDHYDDGVVTDYKIVSAWSVIDGVKVEWERQLNLYAWMLRRSGKPVERLQIVALYRDWSRAEAERDALTAAGPGGPAARYPATAVEVKRVRLWSVEEAESYVAERVRLHRTMPPPPCTPEERWRRPTKWAVYRKPSDTRALRVLDTQEEADALASQVGGVVRRRDGDDVRCRSYCVVRDFCGIKEVR